MILVTGANSYVGGHLIQRLCSKGRIVRALVRRGCSSDEKAFLAELGAEVVEADIEERGALMRALEGVKTVVHLLGSIERPRAIGYRGMHTRKTSLLLKAFKATLCASNYKASSVQSADSGRIVYLSAVGASPSAGNLYQKTKWDAEQQIKHSGLDYIIIRSSLIFGRETGQRDSKLVRKLTKLALSSKAMPLIGSGNNRMQPIYIADLVACMEKAIDFPEGCREIWEVGGPDVLSLREISDVLLKAFGLERRIITVPYSLAFVLGAVARLLRREEKINFEQVKMSKHDNICSYNRAADLLSSRMTSFENGIGKTVKRFGVEAMSGRVKS